MFIIRLFELYNLNKPSLNINSKSLNAHNNYMMKHTSIVLVLIFR